MFLHSPRQYWPSETKPGASFQTLASPHPGTYRSEICEHWLWVGFCNLHFFPLGVCVICAKPFVPQYLTQMLTDSVCSFCPIFLLCLLYDSGEALLYRVLVIFIAKIDPQNCSVPTLEEDAQTAPEVAECLFLLLACVAGQGRCQLPHLHLRHWGPSTQGLCFHGQEGNAPAGLPPAILLCSSQLLLLLVFRHLVSWSA